ncbi:hypothetical protein [Burkholderia pseudomallei]|uniref:hypothetical protein n=1 Tax=Burkholderia pseudomallei TaxID=28450 RepID=UPI00105CBBD0|nr:hypothetical protein [Burkholderia pseudomallei]
MFYTYVNQLPMVRDNPTLFRGVALHFKTGHVRLVMKGMVYERAFLVRDKRRDVLYHIKQDQLEIHRGPKAQPPNSVMLIKDKWADAKLNLSSVKDLDHRDEVRNLIQLLADMSEEWDMQTSKWTEFFSWAATRVGIAVLTGGLVYVILTAIVFING